MKTSLYKLLIKNHKFYHKNSSFHSIKSLILLSLYPNSFPAVKKNCKTFFFYAPSVLNVIISKICSNSISLIIHPLSITTFRMFINYFSSFAMDPLEIFLYSKNPNNLLYISRCLLFKAILSFFFLVSSTLKFIVSCLLSSSDLDSDQRISSFSLSIKGLSKSNLSISFINFLLIFFFY